VSSESRILRLLPARLKGLIKTTAWKLVRSEVADAQRGQIRMQLDEYLTRLDFSEALAASIERADYVRRHMRAAEPCVDRFAVLETAIAAAGPCGSTLEFGVFDGTSINFIADRRPDATVHGFDSFEGLPEDWMSYVTKGEVGKGEFDLRGQLPAVRSNVDLHVGWFDEVLPTFLDGNEDPVSFLHIDCDLYSSTKTVFSLLGARIGANCVIVFDEYVGYPGWQEHEYRAFQEFITEHGLSYRYLAFNENEWQVAVVIE
jgi:hypothetical protein